MCACAKLLLHVLYHTHAHVTSTCKIAGRLKHLKSSKFSDRTDGLADRIWPKLANTIPQIDCPVSYSTAQSSTVAVSTTIRAQIQLLYSRVQLQYTYNPVQGQYSYSTLKSRVAFERKTSVVRAIQTEDVNQKVPEADK